MNDIDDDTVQAYVDGELDPEASARIEAALARDGALAERVRLARAVRGRVQAAFDPVLDEPVPARLAALLQPPSAQAPTPVAVPAAAATGSGRGLGAGRRRTPHRWWVPSAMAASLALLAVTFWWRPGDEMVRVQDDQGFASGTLARALDQALASEPDPQAAVAIGLSFRGADGRVCRSFVHRRAPALAGLACRDAGGWALPVLDATVGSEGGELRQAASALTPEVQAAVDARLRGDVFDARQERAARDAGWR